MAKWILVLVVAVAAAGCDDDVPCASDCEWTDDAGLLDAPVDAPVDTPPRDSCEPSDAPGSSALTPHC